MNERRYTSLKIKLSIISFFFFITVTPVIIGVSLFSLATSKSDVLSSETEYPYSAPVQIFAAYPETSPSTDFNLISSDARGDIVKSYLNRYESPLEPYAYYIVNIADEYGVDFRLITAIAQQESNLCKYIPPDTFNCWGWGIHSRGTLGFNSYEDGIETVTAGLKKEYLDKGYTNPDEIMKKYTPLSNGSWAQGVNSFLAQME